MIGNRNPGSRWYRSSPVSRAMIATGRVVLGPTEVWVAGIPPGKIGHFAGEARVTTANDVDGGPSQQCFIGDRRSARLPVLA
jgi:hypothetical protein